MRILLLLAAVSALFITGCSTGEKEINRKLDRAEQILRENPDSAFEQLDAIDVSKLNDSKTIARWTALYGEALLCNGLVSLDDNDTMHARYVQKLRESSERRARYERQSSIIISVLMTFILILFVSFQNRRAMYHKARNEVLLTKASSLQSAVKCNRLLLSRREEAINESFAERMGRIDSLCAEYYESTGTATEKYEIVCRLSEVLDSMRCDSEAFAMFEGVVNDRRPNLLPLLHKEIPSISTDDYRLYICLACGMSVQTISLLTGETVAAIYHHRDRLRHQLDLLSPDSKRILMEMV